VALDKDKAVVGVKLLAVKNMIFISVVEHTLHWYWRWQHMFDPGDKENITAEKSVNAGKSVSAGKSVNAGKKVSAGKKASAVGDRGVGKDTCNDSAELNNRLFF
jgi:hypothetical protein